MSCHPVPLICIIISHVRLGLSLLSFLQVSLPRALFAVRFAPIRSTGSVHLGHDLIIRIVFGVQIVKLFIMLFSPVSSFLPSFVNLSLSNTFEFLEGSWFNYQFNKYLFGRVILKCH